MVVVFVAVALIAAVVIFVAVVAVDGDAENLSVDGADVVGAR